MESTRKAHVTTRSLSEEYMPSLVSVDKAKQLQRMSMRRFKSESCCDVQLRRMLGHVSVNQRSTEIIRTASFEDEMVRETEERFVHEEEVPTEESMFSHYDPIYSSLVSESLAADSEEQHDWIQMPTIMGREITSIPIEDPSWMTGEPDDATEMAIMHAADELMATVDNDWMYDVLNLQIDNGTLIDTTTDTPIPRSVAIQIWKVVLESLIGFSKRDGQIETLRNASQLEAAAAAVYGSSSPSITASSMPVHPDSASVGLGLVCHQDIRQQHNTLPQMATAT